MVELDVTEPDITELSKLRWHCRRGIKELDIVLNQYLEQYYIKAREYEKTAFKVAFKELLSLEDPILYALLLGNVEPVNDGQRVLVSKLINMNST